MKKVVVILTACSMMFLASCSQYTCATYVKKAPVEKRGIKADNAVRNS